MCRSPVTTLATGISEIAATQGLRLRASPAGGEDERLGSSDLMEQACNAKNLWAALKRKSRDRRDDGRRTGRLSARAPRLREELLAGKSRLLTASFPQTRRKPVRTT